MKTKTTAALLFLFLLPLLSTNCPAQDKFIGNWALTIPNGGAGWLGVDEKDGQLSASLLWGGGSVKPVSSTRVEGRQLIITRDQVQRGGKDKTQKIVETITATRDGKKLNLITEKTKPNGEKFARALFTGKLTTIPPKPDLSAVKYGDPIKLFNGRDLSGWESLNEKHAMGWSVKESVLQNRTHHEDGKRKPHANIRTEAEFEDFQLSVEFRTLKDSNSGIYLRGIYEIQILESFGRPVNAHNTGGLYSRITPSVAAEKPIGQWQTMEITLVDKHITVVLNDQTIIDNQPALGCTGGALWSDPDRAGPIYLQGNHSDVDFRKLDLRPVVTDQSAQTSSSNETTQRQALLEQLSLQSHYELANLSEQHGDIARGQAIFGREKLGCVKCHQALGDNSAQQPVGPLLNMVGDRLSTEHIVRSILDPNETVPEDFQSYVVATIDGDLITGVLVRQSEEEVVLVDVEKGQIVISRDDIEEMKKTKSAMPENIVNDIGDRQEFYDLVKYLSSRKASALGTAVTAGDSLTVKDIPKRPGQPRMLAISRPDGICYTYIPHYARPEKIWQGPLGWKMPDGTMVLNESSAQAFHIRNRPWKIDVGKGEFDFSWIGHKVVDSNVVMSYQLKDKKEGRVWKVEEWLDVVSPLQQSLRFKITHPEGTNEVLTYWLAQTKFRSVKTNGQQAQRNQLEFLKPGQSDYELTLLRRRSGTTVPDGYSIHRLPGPQIEKPYLFEPASFSFAPDGTAFVSTRTGALWRYHDQKWNLFADGLHESLGVCVSQNGRDVYAMQKPELTRLEDADSDGVAEVYRTVTDRFRFTGQYHEFAFGPVMNSQGELFFSLGLSAAGYHEVKETQTGQMCSPLGYRGWMMKVDTEGQTIPFASGMRSPAGIGINDQDEIFITDNQGDWVGSSYLGHVEQDDFLGHPAALWDKTEYGLTPRELDYKTVDARVKKVPKLDEDKFKATRKRPAVWLVHGDLANSPGNPAFCPKNGFGPFEGQAFIADISHRAVVRVALEKVNGQYQGAAFPFVRPLASCAYSTGFDSDGNLWVGSVGRGWTTGDPIIEVIKYDPANPPFEMQRIELTKNGFDIHFTQPVAEPRSDAFQIDVKHFHYLYWAEYGSDRQDYQPVSIEKIQLSPDRKTLSLTVPLKQDKVYEIDLGFIKSTQGSELKNNFAYYTLNELQQ